MSFVIVNTADYWGQIVDGTLYLSYRMFTGTGPSAAFDQAIATHELGHLVAALNDVSSCTANDTIMYYAGDPSGSFATSVTSCDLQQLAYLYGTQNGSDDCNDVCDPSYDQIEACSGDYAYWDDGLCDCETSCNPDPGDVFSCEHQDDAYYWDYDNTCSCQPGSSPIVVDLDGGGFDLTSASQGVQFDLLATGNPVQTAWTNASRATAFLALDRNGDGLINDGSELFGNVTLQPASPGEPRNGFLALAVFDSPGEGGNGDGLITSADRVFSQLRLWLDINHDGVSQPGELMTLKEAGVVGVELKYRRSARRDKYGNMFRYRGVVQIQDPLCSEQPLRERPDVDVFLSIVR